MISLFRTCFLAKNIRTESAQVTRAASDLVLDLKQFLFRQMAWSGLIPVRLTEILFPPYFEANNKRKGPFDAFKGHLSDFFTHLFRSARFNVTIIEASEVGDCNLNGTCTGMYEDLRTNRADLSTNALPVDFDPNLDITSNYPVVLGPANGVQEIVFTSLPYKSSSKVDFDVLSTFESTPWYLGVIQMVIFFCFFFLINTSFVNSRAPKLRMRRRISVMDMFASYMNQLSLFFRQPHRFVILVTMIFHTTLLTIIIGGNISADMVAEFPPQYYSSLEQVVTKYLPDHRPIVFKGLVVESKLVHTNPKFQPLGRVAQAIPLVAFDKTIQKLKNKSVLVSYTMNVNTLRAYICIWHLKDTSLYLLRRSPILHSTHLFFPFSSNASSELKKRWTRISHDLKESGLFEHFHRKERNILVLALTDDDKLRYHRCLWRTSLMRKTSVVSKSFSAFHFNRPLRVMASIHLLAVMVLCVEAICGHIRSRNK